MSKKVKLLKVYFYKKMYKTFGLGKKTLNKIYSKIGINLKTRPKIIKKRHQTKVFKFLKNKKLNQDLKNYKRYRINILINNKSCKGWRHRFKYPVRGQRTHTNAKTCKRVRF